MKIGTLRKLYPYMSKQRKNLKWRRVTDFEIEKAFKEPQVSANCFIDSTRIALFNSDYGKKMVKDRIWVERGKNKTPAYKFKFFANNKEGIYRADRKDYFSKFFFLYRAYMEDKKGHANFRESVSKTFNLAMDIAVTKMVKKNPEQKEWYLKIYRKPLFTNMLCEYNKPSRAFEWLTGKKPSVIIAENGLTNSLKDNYKETLGILNKLGQLNPEEYSFILMTGNKKAGWIPKWHCLPIVGVDEKSQTVSILNKREKFVMHCTFEEVLNNYKALVGTFF